MNESTGKPFNPPPGTDVLASGTVEYVMTLDKTPIRLILDRAKAPCTVNSFEWLAKIGYFDGMACEQDMLSGLRSTYCGARAEYKSPGGLGYHFAERTGTPPVYTGTPPVYEVPVGALVMEDGGEPDHNRSNFSIRYAGATWPKDPLVPPSVVFGTTDSAGVEAAARIDSAKVVSVTKV